MSYRNSSVVEEDIIAEPLNLTVSLRGTREVKDSYQIFRLTGLLDAFSEPTFRKVISGYISDGPARIVLDLSATDFLDSSGLGALVQLAKQARGEKNGDLHIVTNSRVTQTVKLVRLEKFLPLHATLNEAIAALPEDKTAGKEKPAKSEPAKSESESTPPKSKSKTASPSEAIAPPEEKTAGKEKPAKSESAPPKSKSKTAKKSE